MTEIFPSEIELTHGPRPDETLSGLLVTVVAKAREIGFAETLTEGLNLPMKVYRYSHQNKIETVIASIVVGCQHISEIQTRLVPDTVAASLFGLARFPDQAQVNLFLRACGPAQVEHLEGAHARLLGYHSRVGDRQLWATVGSAQPVRLLPVDLDQTSLATQSTRATGAAKGYMGRKRSQYGYRKTVALLGGGVQEVLGVRLEPGDTHGQESVPLVLGQLADLLRLRGIASRDVLMRGDSQYGSAGTVRQFQAARHHYLVKGYTPRSAEHFANTLPREAVWEAMGVDSYGNQLWVVDAGDQELRGHDDPPDLPPVRSRVVLLVRVGWRVRTKHGKGAPDQVREKVVSFEHYLTDLGADVLTPPEVIALYNGRETEESFFRAEQDAFGAHSLRTYHGPGEAVFLWILASTINLLRWVQHSTFADTPIENLGLTRLVTQVMRLPATITRTATTWIVSLPTLARLVHALVHAWLTRAVQLPLPFKEGYSFG